METICDSCQSPVIAYITVINNHIPERWCLDCVRGEVAIYD